MESRQRRRLLIDGPVQGAFLGRMAAYWLTYATATTLMQFCWVIWTQSPSSSADLLARVWNQCGPAVLASVLVLPMVMLDCLRLSNRFAGPAFRLRRALRELSHGRPVARQQLRKGDFWWDSADDFNRLLDLLKAAQEEPDRARTDSDPGDDKPADVRRPQETGASI